MTLPPVQWIERVIRINSVTDRSNDELVRFLVPLIRETGLHFEEQVVSDGKKRFVNVLAFNDSLRAANLLVLNTHLDTVSPGNKALWSKTHGDPFRATISKDKVYGLGSADVKLDFLCKLVAIRQAKPWVAPFALIGTFGEERGLVGARMLLKERKLSPRFAVVGEPSNLELIYAHKGHLIVTVSFDLQTENVRFLKKTLSKSWKGRSAHSSTPHLGKNALEMALHDIFRKGWGIIRLVADSDSNRIPDHCEGEFVPQLTHTTDRIRAFFENLQLLRREISTLKDKAFDPSQSTLSINCAETAHGELRLTFDVRTLPKLDNTKLIHRIRSIARLSRAKIMNLHIDEPLSGNKTSRLMEMASTTLITCGVKPVARTKASSTEAAVYNAEGAEAIVFGPGVSTGNVHRPNEYNSFKQMGIAVEFYTQLLRRFDRI